MPTRGWDRWCGAAQWDGFGQLGNDDTLSSGPVPVRIRPDLTWDSAAAGSTHTVAVTTDGRLFTWGRDTDGQLGNGAPNTNSAAPVQVTLP